MTAYNFSQVPMLEALRIYESGEKPRWRSEATAQQVHPYPVIPDSDN
jgi:hypothetical protein